MIPFVVAGGICIALAFRIRGINAEGELASAINELGGIAMGLMWPILGGYVAFSICGSSRSCSRNGFRNDCLIDECRILRRTIGGLLAGYTVYWLKKC